MNREQVHDLMENELRCVQRGNYCDRDCAKCPLVKDDKELIEAYGYVIKALEQEPCEDAISRKALLEEIENGIKAGNYEEGYEEYPNINDMDDIIECIKYADSVQPKPKTDVLDKVRAEIADLDDTDYDFEGYYKAITDALQILDKYKAESEDKE